VRAIIMVGGRGVRLQPYTTAIPKSLLPLGETPIIEIVITQLARAGFDRITLMLGHMGYLFQAAVGDGSRWGIKVDYCLEHEPLGTAAPLRLVEDLDEHFLVMNGDVLTTLDFLQAIETHLAAKAAATIISKTREVRIEFGVTKTDDEGFLVDYIEKPTYTYNVSTGINILSRQCLDVIPAEGAFDMPNLMLAVKNSGRKVLCHLTQSYWQDIGNFDDYQRASRDFVDDSSKFIPEQKE
jgi:NDP-sugar pyrophosphorylase family protein